MYDMARNKLSELRKKCNLSQAALAKVIGTSKDQIYKLEHGQRKLTEDWLTQLCTALSCTPNDILGYSSLNVVSTNENPIYIDNTLYELSKSVVLDLMREENITMTEEEILDEVYNAYQIASEIQIKSGEVKPLLVAGKWYQQYSAK